MYIDQISRRNRASNKHVSDIAHYCMGHACGIFSYSHVRKVYDYGLLDKL